MEKNVRAEYKIQEFLKQRIGAQRGLSKLQEHCMWRDKQITRACWGSVVSSSVSQRCRANVERAWNCR